MRAADVLCLPSRTETFGMVVLEAWRAETPVLTSDIPALLGLVGPSGGGWNVALDPAQIAEKLDQLIATPQQLRTAGRAGNKHWRKAHSAARVAERHGAVYAKALNDHAERIPRPPSRTSSR